MLIQAAPGAAAPQPTVVAPGILTSGAAAGSAVITYSITDLNGCTGTTTAPVTVNALPTVVAIGGSSSVCVGATIALSDATSGGAWSSSLTTVAAIAPSGMVSGMAVGTTTITYSVTNELGCTGNKQKIVTVNTVPVAGIISGLATLYVGSTDTLSETISGGAWTNTNHPVATITAGVVYGVSAGSSTISYTVTNTCGAAHATFAVTVANHALGRNAGPGDTTASTGDVINAQETIMVYPNPTTGAFIVDLSEITGDLAVTITDVQGRIIETGKVSGKDDRKLQYNLSNMARGTYLIKVYGGDTIYGEKVVIW
jgi:hypothetical protein